MKTEKSHIYLTFLASHMLPSKFNFSFGHRFKHKPPPPWQAITASTGVLVITLLLGHIFHAANNRIAKGERGYREMMTLKHRAEIADVAKSQVHFRSHARCI